MMCNDALHQCRRGEIVTKNLGDLSITVREYLFAYVIF